MKESKANQTINIMRISPLVFISGAIQAAIDQYELIGKDAAAQYAAEQEKLEPDVDVLVGLFPKITDANSYLEALRDLLSRVDAAKNNSEEIIPKLAHEVMPLIVQLELPEWIPIHLENLAQEPTFFEASIGNSPNEKIIYQLHQELCAYLAVNRDKLHPDTVKKMQAFDEKLQQLVLPKSIMEERLIKICCEVTNYFVMLKRAVMAAAKQIKQKQNAVESFVGELIDAAEKKLELQCTETDFIDKLTDFIDKLTFNLSTNSPGIYFRAVLYNLVSDSIRQASEEQNELAEFRAKLISPDYSNKTVREIYEEAKKIITSQQKLKHLDSYYDVYVQHCSPKQTEEADLQVNPERGFKKKKKKEKRKAQKMQEEQARLEKEKAEQEKVEQAKAEEEEEEEEESVRREREEKERQEQARQEQARLDQLEKEKKAQIKMEQDRIEKEKKEKVQERLEQEKRDAAERQQKAAAEVAEKQEQGASVEKSPQDIGVLVESIQALSEHIKLTAEYLSSVKKKLKIEEDKQPGLDQKNIEQLKAESEKIQGQIQCLVLTTEQKQKKERQKLEADKKIIQAHFESLKPLAREKQFVGEKGETWEDLKLKNYLQDYIKAAVNKDNARETKFAVIRKAVRRTGFGGIVDDVLDWFEDKAGIKFGSKKARENKMFLKFDEWRKDKREEAAFVEQVKADQQEIQKIDAAIQVASALLQNNDAQILALTKQAKEIDGQISAQISTENKVKEMTAEKEQLEKDLQVMKKQLVKLEEERAQLEAKLPVTCSPGL